MSRSRFDIHAQFDGMYQSFNFSSLPSTFAPISPLPYRCADRSYRPSPVGAHATPFESMAAPVRPQRPPLLGLKVMTLFWGSVRSIAHIWFGLPAQPCDVVVKMTLFHKFSAYAFALGYPKGMGEAVSSPVARLRE